MPAPKLIGVTVVIAAIAGYIPGIPGLLGSDPPPEEEAIAEELLPPAPEVIPVETGDPVLPDDGLTRVIVTPTDMARPTAPPAAGPAVGPAADEDVSGEAERPIDPADPAVPDPEPPVESESPSATEPEANPAADPDGGGGPGGSDDIGDYDIAAAALAELTNGAVLELDADGRPWAVWVDQDVRVPLWMDLLPSAETPGAAPAAEPTPIATPDATPIEPVEAPGPAEDDLAPAVSLGHPTADLVAGLPGVRTIVSVGDGSFAVALEDPSVLDGLPLTVDDDPAMGIGSEPYEGYQWALDNNGANLDGVGSGGLAQTADADVDGVEARAGATGHGVVVAVIDSGVDFSHRDLAGAQWVNHGERCGNGIDDDTNGYVDDCTGWDFGYEDNAPFNVGAHPHGTHVAGIIAAAVDGYGVAGVAPRARIMDLNVGTITRSGQPGITTSAVARAIRYAADNGAGVINLSLGTAPGSPRAGSSAVESAIGHAESQGVLVVAAAGNDGTNLDGAPSWPASYENSNMVTVGASSPSDSRASFSNYGAVIDVFAPGELILSTVPASDGNFTFMSGTSQAAPIVAGVAALVLERSPGLTPAQLRAELIGTGDRHADLAAFVADGVRVNAANALGLGESVDAIDELGLAVSGLHDARAGQPVRAAVDIAVPDGWFADAYEWSASLFVTRGGDRYGLVGLPVAVDGVPATTDARAGVSLGFDGSGGAVLEADLPAGDYAFVVEATADSGDERLGPPHVVTFVVAGTEPAASPSGADDASPQVDPGAPAGDDPVPNDGSGQSGADGPAGDGGISDEPATGGAGAPPPAGETSPAPGAEAPAPGQDGDPLGSPGGEAGAGGDAATTDPPPAEAGPPASAPPQADDPAAVSPEGAGDGGTTPRHLDPSPPASDVEPPAVLPDPPPPTTAGEWTVDSVTPHTGPTGAMTLVQLNGDFPRHSYVWFGEAAGTVLLYSSRMLLVLSPPAAAPGSVDVSLRRTGEGTVLTVPDAFTYLDDLTGDGPSAPSDPVAPNDPPPDAPGPEEGNGDQGGSSAPEDTSGTEPPAGDAGDTGGPVSPDPGAGDGGRPDAPGDGGELPGDDRTSTVETRVALAAETTDLGDGLTGALVLGGDPVAGAPACRADPCPMG